MLEEMQSEKGSSLLFCFYYINVMSWESLNEALITAYTSSRLSSTITKSDDLEALPFSAASTMVVVSRGFLLEITIL